MKKSFQIKVTGKVQNVGFRYYTRKTANDLFISGYVRNQSDGSVYIEAEGDEQNMAQFISWCQVGPSWARVEDVDIQEQPLQQFQGFMVR
jgi:acylphosphatase